MTTVMCGEPPLPGQLFYGSPIPVCLWLVARNESNGKFRDRRKQSLFIDGRKLGRLVDRVHRDLSDEEISRLAGTYMRGEARKTQASSRMCPASAYRHGRKPRRLTLRTGAVQLEVPRGRLVTPDGGKQEWHSQLAPRYRRSSAEVEQSVLGVYLSGSNTRRIEARRFSTHRLQGVALRTDLPPKQCVQELRESWPGYPLNSICFPN